MIFPVDNFRSHIPRSSWSVFVILLLNDSGNTKVSKTKVPFLINDNILWLNITMDDMITM